MKGLVTKAYEWLASGPEPDCDRVLAAALDHADGPWAARLIALLVRRASDASWAGLMQHYQNLPDATRQLVRQRPDLICGGAPLAVRASRAEVRAGVMSLLADEPMPRLMYLAANALRDTDIRVRELAAAALRKCAERQADQTENTAGESSTGENRAQMVRALDDALRMFEAHRRADVLEASLWFAPELGERLWHTIGEPRSHAGILVTERLKAWSHPRLAAFLLLALKQPAWRALATQLISEWRQIDHVSALLRHSALLEDIEVRARLSGVRKPQWFEQCGPALSDLPADVRPCAPRWVLYSGLPAERKIGYLRAWLRSDDDALRRAAAQGLAAINAPDLVETLEPLAKGDGPLAAFCRWYVRARKMELVPNRRPSREPSSSPPQATCGTDFSLLWQVCRRSNPAQRSELVALIRENSEAWRERIRSSFRSPDPRDRVLALQIASTPSLALRFRAEVQHLMDDPIRGIRKLADTLVRSIESTTNTPDDDRERGAAHQGVAAPQSDRDRLRDLLADAARSDSDVSPEQLAEIRNLMQHVYGFTPAAEHEELLA